MNAKNDKEQVLGHTSRTGWEVYFGLIIFSWNKQVVYLKVIVVVYIRAFQIVNWHYFYKFVALY